MAWIVSHQELGGHPKTKRLARVLGISVPAAVGHLHFLWWWALDYADDGDLGDYDNFDVAEAAMWEGDADAFVRALVDCGPGDKHGFAEYVNGRLRLHDWLEYAGKLIQSRQECSEAGVKGNHERWHVKRGVYDPSCPYCRDGMAADSEGESDSESGSESGGESGRDQDQNQVLSHSTQHNNTLHNTTIECNMCASPTAGYTDDFEAFWSVYPRKIEKKAAYRAWCATLKGRKDAGAPPTPEILVLCAKHYAANCVAERTEQQFIKHPKTFLGPSESWRDWMEPRTRASPPKRELPIDQELKKAGVDW